jgi:acetolactate synthase I/II/III large subunit
MAATPVTSPSGDARTGAEDLVAALAAAGVDHVFGLPGTTIMDILDALARQDTIRYITVRHEQVAAFMADGYARASGQVGVCLASRGPGAANMAIGVHNSRAESTPVLAVVGQVGDDIAARHAFEEADLLAMFAPMTKWAVEVHDTARIRELAVRAVHTAAEGRPGPVLLSLPLDVQQRPVSPVGTPPDGAPAGAAAPAAAQVPGRMPAGRIYRPGADPEGAAHVARLLAAAGRPVLIVGGGVTGDRAHAAVTALAAAAGAPVVTTWQRKSQFPNDDPHYAGVLGYGAHPAAEAAVRGADLIVALGCRFSEFTSRRWTLVPPGTAVIQVDIDADEIGRTVPVTVGLQADAALAAESISQALGTPPGEPGSPAYPVHRAARVRRVRPPGWTRPAARPGAVTCGAGTRPRAGCPAARTRVQARAHRAHRAHRPSPCRPPRWSPNCRRRWTGTVPSWSRTCTPSGRGSRVT